MSSSAASSAILLLLCSISLRTSVAALALASCCAMSCSAATSCSYACSTVTGCIPAETTCTLHHLPCCAEHPFMDFVCLHLGCRFKQPFEKARTTAGLSTRSYQMGLSIGAVLTPFQHTCLLGCHEQSINATLAGLIVQWIIPVQVQAVLQSLLCSNSKLHTHKAVPLGQCPSALPRVRLAASCAFSAGDTKAPYTHCSTRPVRCGLSPSEAFLGQPFSSSTCPCALTYDNRQYACWSGSTTLLSAYRSSNMLAPAAAKQDGLTRHDLDHTHLAPEMEWVSSIIVYSSSSWAVNANKQRHLMAICICS